MLQNDFLASLGRVEGLKKKKNVAEWKESWEITSFEFEGSLARKPLVPLINSLWKSQKMRGDD